MTLFDSPIFSQYLSDDETVRLLADDTRIAMLLRVEIALARAQARADMIPAEAAETIAECLTDLSALTRSFTGRKYAPEWYSYDRLAGAWQKKQLPDLVAGLSAFRSDLAGHHRHGIRADDASRY